MTYFLNSLRNRYLENNLERMQMMQEVHKNYREDMNLKTLAYKYNMNASYLGQIFQKMPRRMRGKFWKK